MTFLPTGAFGQQCGSITRIYGGFTATQVTVSSGRHTAGALGAQILGFSSTNHHRQALPLKVDPLVGTVGCQRSVSIDITQIGFVSGVGRLVFPALATKPVVVRTERPARSAR